MAMRSRAAWTSQRARSSRVGHEQREVEEAAVAVGRPGAGLLVEHEQILATAAQGAAAVIVGGPSAM